MSRRGYCATCNAEIPDHYGNCPDAGGYDNLYEAEEAASRSTGCDCAHCAPGESA